MSVDRRYEAIRDSSVLAAEYLGGALYYKYREQSWYQRFANTVTVTAGVTITIVGQLVAGGFEFPEWVKWVILAVTLLGTIFGTYSTKNGLSKSQLESLTRLPQERLQQLESEAISRVEEHFQEGLETFTQKAEGVYEKAKLGSSDFEVFSEDPLNFNKSLEEKFRENLLNFR